MREVPREFRLRRTGARGSGSGPQGVAFHPLVQSWSSSVVTDGESAGRELPRGFVPTSPVSYNPVWEGAAGLLRRAWGQ